MTAPPIKPPGWDSGVVRECNDCGSYVIFVKDKKYHEDGSAHRCNERSGRSVHSSSQRKDLRAPGPPPEPVPTKEIDYSEGRIRLSDVRPERTKWLWPGFIPLGKLTVLDGDPGVGKSTITLDLAARITRRAHMPDGSSGDLAGAAGVVILAHEDGIADTMLPRLLAAGGDPARVLIRQHVHNPDGSVRIPDLDDIATLEADIRHADAKLLIIDPLMAHVPIRTNPNSDQQIRALLTPLADLAQRLGIAVVVVRHLNKNTQTSAAYRGGGSIGIRGAARATLLAANHPEGDGKKILILDKSNLAEGGRGMAYRIERAENHSSRIVWEGPDFVSPSRLLSPPTGERVPSRLDEAQEFLLDALAHGPRLAHEVQDEARATGIALQTLRRAKDEIGIKSQKLGMNGGWSWSLPDQF